MRNTANNTRRAARRRPSTTPAPDKRAAASRDYTIDPAAVAEAIVGRRSALVALGVAKPATP
jgi:hypothetical protein